MFSDFGGLALWFDFLFCYLVFYCFGCLCSSVLRSCLNIWLLFGVLF